MNELTREDIKNSVEYKWRNGQKYLMLGLYLTVAVMSLLFALFGAMIGGSELSNNGLEIAFEAWLIVMLIFSFTFGPFIIFYHCKAQLFLKKYEAFEQFTAVLDSPETSYWYRGAVYYTVKINDGVTYTEAQTNPYFSSALFSNFNISDYNNKKVIGLLDAEKGKFYIVKIAD